MAKRTKTPKIDFFGRIPNIFARTQLLDSAETKAARDAAEAGFKEQLEVAVYAFNLAELCIQQAAFAIAEVLRPCMSVAMDDPFVTVRVIHGDGLKQTYHSLAGVPAELGKILEALAGIHVQFYADANVNGVEFEIEQFQAGLPLVPDQEKGGAE